MEILIALAAVVVVVGVVVGRWWLWAPVVRHRVAVQLVDGTSMVGVIVSRRGPLLVLDDVTVVHGQTSRAVDGRMVVDRARVLWMQVIS